MKRRKAPAVDTEQVIRDWPTETYQLIVVVAILEGVAHKTADIWPAARWIIWQLPIAYLLWEYVSLRRARDRLVDAWNERVLKERRKRPPRLSSSSPAESDERIRRWLTAGEKRDDADDSRES